MIESFRQQKKRKKKLYSKFILRDQNLIIFIFLLPKGTNVQTKVEQHREIVRMDMEFAV